MTITTKLEDVTIKGAKIGVHIKTERPKRAEDVPEIVSNVVDDLYHTMEIVSILRALKDYNEIAFNSAMEHFIEEEIAEAREEAEDE